MWCAARRPSNHLQRVAERPVVGSVAVRCRSGGSVGLGHDFSGLQWGWAGSYNTGRLSGVQLAGLGNYTVSGKGVQWSGIFNGSEDFGGLQVALVNYTKSLQGLQVGLINIITEGGDIFGLPIFPFVNFDF